MLKLHLFTFLGILVAVSAVAMYDPLPMPELVKSSDLIVIAKVQASKQGPRHAKGYDQIQTDLAVERVLKGDWKVETPLSILLFDTKGKFVEDKAKMPDTGTRTILFLRKAKDGELRLVDRGNSIWKLKDEANTVVSLWEGMTLQQLEAELSTSKGK